MRHTLNVMQLHGYTCSVYTEAQPSAFLLVQPVDSNDQKELPQEVVYMEEHCSQTFTFVAIHIPRWFEQLAPWCAPPIFGKTPFGDGAAATLHDIRLICTSILAETSAASCMPVVLGGYSLAGLFALWSGYQYAFDAVVAASPSVWYPQWLLYASEHRPLTHTFYLSIGDTESKSKNKIFSTVDDCLHHNVLLLEAKQVVHHFEYNQGNHFQENGVRTAKGFVWAMERYMSTR